MRLGDLPGNTALVICEAVLENELPLGYVANEEDGPQATCGVRLHGSEEGQCRGKVICLSGLFDRDPDGDALRDLEAGFCARKEDGVWVIKALSEPEESPA